MKTKMPAFPVFSYFVGSSKESVLFSKSNLSASYSTMKKKLALGASKLVKKRFVLEI
jgi:hypothetical protein